MGNGDNVQLSDSLQCSELSRLRSLTFHSSTCSQKTMSASADPALYLNEPSHRTPKTMEPQSAPHPSREIKIPTQRLRPQPHTTPHVHRQTSPPPGAPAASLTGKHTPHPPSEQPHTTPSFTPWPSLAPFPGAAVTGEKLALPIPRPPPPGGGHFQRTSTAGQYVHIRDLGSSTLGRYRQKRG